MRSRPGHHAASISHLVLLLSSFIMASGWRRILRPSSRVMNGNNCGRALGFTSSAWGATFRRPCSTDYRTSIISQASVPLMTKPPQNKRRRLRASGDGVDGTPPVLLHDDVDDTIFALSSGQGKAGVAAIRVSGALAGAALQKLTTPPSGSLTSKLPEARRAALRRLYHPCTGEMLDEALILWFPGPRSFTGEDTVELQVHGSRAVVQGVTEALMALNDPEEGRGGMKLRPADRGEFTQRAFANGRMDLTEVEGLADLIAADTSAQRRQALKQMGGALKETYEAWREELKVCLAHTEAVIDFGDDELDVDEAAYDAIRPRVSKLRQQLRLHLADGGRGEVIRSGIRVAIVGPPNAGKSTLLNLLARRPAAIVSPIAGTTRDVVEVQLELGGLPVIVSDTAGIREATSDPVELEGIRRAREAAGAAHVSVIVLDASAQDIDAQVSSLASLPGMGEEKVGTDLNGLLETMKAGGGAGRLLLVVNKGDTLEGSGQLQQLRVKMGGVPGASLVSCLTGEGVDGLLNQIEGRLRQEFERGDAEAPVISRARHRFHVERCVEALSRFLEDRTLGLDTAAEELRIASTELGHITGAVDVEEVLDVIFRDFCIGK